MIDHLWSFSRTSLSTCLLQINTPAQPLFWSTFEYYPLVSRGYQPIALHLMNFWWSSTFPRHSHSTGSGLSSTENTDLWIKSTLWFSTSSTSLLRSLLILQVIPSLIGYIIIVQLLTVLPGPYSRSTTFDDELSLRRFSSSYHFALNSKLDFEFVSYPWFQ